jgi:hypothetical protein
VPSIGMVVSMQCWKETLGPDRRILGAMSRLTPPPLIHLARSELHFGDRHSTLAKRPPRYTLTMDSGAPGSSSPSGPTPEAWERRRSPAGLSLFLCHLASLCSALAPSQITKASCTTFSTKQFSCIHLNLSI